MRDFVYYSPTRFVFGQKMVDTTGAEMAAMGFNRVLLVYGKGSVVRSGVLDRVKASLEAAGVSYIEAGGVRPNPEVNWVRDAIAKARENEVDGVLAVGGGSTIDAAKATAFGVPYDGDVWDFFAKGQKIEKCLPIAVVLTIPAAGSEASASCVISCDAENRKVGTSGDIFRPKLAIMDPELTFTLPPYQTAAGVTDMIAHICERYFSGVEAVPVTDNIATGLVNALIDDAPRALENPEDYDARATIMWAGMLAHNDIAGCGRSLSPTARAGGWESHALEHELSAQYDITHGEGMAVVFTAWTKHIAKIKPWRLALLAARVFGVDSYDYTEEERALILSEKLEGFFKELGVATSLNELGIGNADFEVMAERATRNGAVGHYVKLDKETFIDVLKEAL